jgi:hypothetical protein
MRRLATCFAILLGLVLLGQLRADELPTIEQLRPNADLPDPLVALDGKRVASQGEWYEKRRPELKRLFQHYMYGFLPQAAKIEADVVSENKDFLGGKATLKQIVLHFGPKETPPIELMVVIPNKPAGPRPCFVGLNFCGNHTLSNDPTIRISQAWMRDGCKGVMNGQASDAGRGSQTDVWNLDLIVDRGYALATAYYGDIDPDRNDFTDGLHPHFLKAGQKELGPHDWGAIGAWAYGLHRMVDYLVTDKAIDEQRIACVGHSRLGKTTLLATALDERIALAIPHQAGCGGTAPSRGKVGESVERINTAFPHWFCDEFTKFNKHPELLPFDQNGLVALCAPRPVLFSNAVEDQWANPDGQFEVLKAASPVYQFLGVEGLKATERPAPGQLINSRLGYFYREGKHSMSREDWEAFLAFADKWL